MEKDLKVCTTAISNNLSKVIVIKGHSQRDVLFYKRKNSKRSDTSQKFYTFADANGG